MTFRPFVTPTLILLIGGWGGLALLLNFSKPTLWPRWGMFALIVLATTGTAIPISFWLNKIFWKNHPAGPVIIVRESVAVGIYFAILAWLSIGRALNFPIAMWLALGLIVVEYLLRIRENSSKNENVPPQSPLS